MTLLFTEGCDSGIDRWTVNNDVTVLSDQSGFGTGYDCFRFANNAGSMYNSIRKDLENDYRANSLINPEYRVSFWLKLDTNSIVANTVFLRFSNYSANVDWELDTYGRLQTRQIRQNYSTGTIAANAALSMSPLTDGNWHFIEIFDRRRSTSTTNGEIQLWVDRTRYISSTSASGFSYNNAVTWNRPVYIQIGNVTGANLLIDDIVVWNSRDASYNSNTTSNTRIYTLRPIGDDNVSNTTPSSGTIKYLMINEKNANTATFINLGNSDRFNMSDINVSSNIFGGTIITKMSRVNTGSKSTIRVDTSTNKGSKNGIANVYYSGLGPQENITYLDVGTIGNTSILLNTLKVEIKKASV